MAATIQILHTTKPNNSSHHVTFSDNFRPRPHSFGQVSLPIKSHTITSISSSSYLTVNAATFLETLPTTTVATTSTVTSTATSLRRPSQPSKLADLWREIQGSNNWEDLVDPLHPLLRSEIIRYGEFVSACYKAFDLDPNSKRYLNCKYGKRNMLKEVGLESSGYEVTKYIYATPDINIPVQAGGGDTCSRWIGYVALSSDEAARKLGRRDVLVTFRGTVTNPEWVANLMSSLTPARLDPHHPRPDVKVESGFLSLYTSDESSSKFGPDSCREQLLSEISRLINKYKGEELSITLAGHSMGSSLAVLLAYDIAELGLAKSDNIPVAVFSFGGPRVGNSEFKRRCEELGVRVLRIANVNDPITKMPGVLFNENFRVLGGKYEFPWSCSCYTHVGVELVLDFFNMQNPSCVHDLETYIGLLKCPNRADADQNNGQRDSTNFNNINNHVMIMGGEFFNMAKDLILSAQNFNMLPWLCVAGNMVSLVQSQGIDNQVDFFS
ncbi:galactolipase DONGLE, chloroplastic-like [Humulus lupulus]|uniref:galactolipase DONGLE, chloroplastic-like n=1 Tax=Humulus lupulus TaxID=3486 RepID=UPI002B408912|nr:galactolipase DONGLE, chloroplastic-like [Humulus lupulus]